jgi:hypothetical protein
VCLPLQASGFGLKAQFVNNEIGPGFGADILGKIDLAEIFFLYPNIDFWYSGNDNNGRYWDHDHWVYYDRWRCSVYETAFNIDAAFKFPVKPVQPFLGFGLAAPVITWENWSDYSYYDRSYVTVGFNMFGGIFFPMGQYTGLFELRGKFGNSYNVFKMAFGIVFESPKNYSYHHNKR